MSDDNDKKALLDLAAYADREVKLHEAHGGGCMPHFIAQQIGDAARAMATSMGPAQVSNSVYRNNWDGIFGKKQPVGQA